MAQPTKPKASNVGPNRRVVKVVSAVRGFVPGVVHEAQHAVPGRDGLGVDLVDGNLRVFGQASLEVLQFEKCAVAQRAVVFIGILAIPPL